MTAELWRLSLGSLQAVDFHVLYIAMLMLLL